MQYVSSVTAMWVGESEGSCVAVVNQECRCVGGYGVFASLKEN